MTLTVTSLVGGRIVLASKGEFWMGPAIIRNPLSESLVKN